MIKRAFDIIFSLIVLFLCSPIFLVAALVIKLEANGPVIFKQRRVGKNGKPFIILKFRTMDDKTGSLLTAACDRRITRIGAALRRTNFDELPQFINIFKGDLSVVGPRPEVPEIVERYSFSQREILNFKPGFTSPATAQSLDEEKFLQGDNLIDYYMRNILPRKIQRDLEYFRTSPNIFQDLLVVLKTIGGTLYA